MYTGCPVQPVAQPNRQHRVLSRCGQTIEPQFWVAVDKLYFPLFVSILNPSTVLRIDTIPRTYVTYLCIKPNRPTLLFAFHSALFQHLAVADRQSSTTHARSIRKCPAYCKKLEHLVPHGREVPEPAKKAATEVTHSTACGTMASEITMTRGTSSSQPKSDLQF